MNKIIKNVVLIIIFITLIVKLETSVFAVRDEENSGIDSSQEEIINANNHNNLISVGTASNKNRANGIYKMAVGANSSKTIEVKGSSEANNEIIDIWDFRECVSTKVLC